MGKNKLVRWNELATFDNVLQPDIDAVSINDHPVKDNWNKIVFRNGNPVIIELGCGKGEYTTGLAKEFPDRNFIGIDIKGARIWRGAKTSKEQDLKNVAFLRTRIEFINSFFGENEVDEIWITFPDPHPGGRNSNKRLTSPNFLNSYRLFLKNNGLVHLKTDNAELFEYTKRVLRKNEIESVFETSDLYSENFRRGDSYIQNKYLEWNSDSNNMFPYQILSIRTHYENIFLNDGLKIKYLSFRLLKERSIEDEFSKT